MSVVFFMLGTTDLLLSLIAFRLGVKEANPFLAWCLQHHVFLAAKLGLTLISSWLIWLLYHYRAGRAVALAGITLMTGVVAYHSWGLGILLYGR